MPVNFCHFDRREKSLRTRYSRYALTLYSLREDFSSPKGLIEMT
jgi:hypothetical protein